jgi:hypothetical protein
MKKIWAEYSSVSCFLRATIGIDDFWLAADKENAIYAANIFLDNQSELLDFLGKAKFVHDTLHLMLDRKTKARLADIDFPEIVVPISLEITPPTTRQLAFIETYMAEVSS